VATLTAKLDAAELQATKLSADLATANQSIATHVAESAKSAESITALTKERDELAAKVKEKIDPTAQALAIVAAQGVPQVNLAAQADATSTTQTVQLKGRERTLAATKIIQ